jgi:photosystem II stability/assembly factor-like uncharacterized protein
MKVNTGSNPSVPTFLMDIKMLNNKVGFVIGYSGGASDQFVLKTVDGGFNWNRIDMGIVGTFNIYNDLNIINTNEIVVSGGSGSNDTGFVIRSKDGGVTWAYDTIPSV